MEQEMKYTIYTDASFDYITKLTTYGIVITQNNRILKAYAEKCKISIKNSGEGEIFAVYKSINEILSYYINDNKKQKFVIKTDSEAAKIFFTNKKVANIFNENDEIRASMIKCFQNANQRLTRDGCSLTIKQVSRRQNKIAHNYSYNLFKKLKSKELIIVPKIVFIQILKKLKQKQCDILIYLIKKSDQNKVIYVTQNKIAEELNISTCIVSNSIKKFERLNLIRKIKNGKYALLI